MAPATIIIPGMLLLLSILEEKRYLMQIGMAYILNDVKDRFRPAKGQKFFMKGRH